MTGPDAGTLDEAEQAAALELAHVFPGPFPVVVIARPEDAFEHRLARLIAELQPAGGNARLSVRPSRGGRYVSYRIELQLPTAHAAVRCRARLAELDGVLLLL